MESKEKKAKSSDNPKPILKWRIDYSLCDGCGECIYACTRTLLKFENKKIVITEEGVCPQCGDCTAACGPRAISLT